MRILLIITLCNLGGAQTVVTQLANKLCKKNEIIVAAGEGDRKMWSMLDSSVQQVHCSHLKRALSPMNDLLTLCDFRKLYKKYQPDIIHLHSSKVGILGRIAFPREKTIYTLHGFDSIRLVYRKYLPLERIMQHFCTAIITVSHYDENNLREENITHNVRTILNGIAKPQSLGYDPFHHIQGYEGKILCIARLAPPKNYDLFLKIAQLLPNYAFIWIGNQQEINRPMPSNVFFMGNLFNAGAYNEYTDLFLLPSDYEGLPISIIEAMSYGKPVVASNVGGIKEIVKDGENGFTLTNNAELFAERIEYILTNPSLNELFSKNSIFLYDKFLTADKMVNNYEKLYQQIADNHN